VKIITNIYLHLSFLNNNKRRIYKKSDISMLCYKLYNVYDLY